MVKELNPQAQVLLQVIKMTEPVVPSELWKHSMFKAVRTSQGAMSRFLGILGQRGLARRNADGTYATVMPREVVERKVALVPHVPQVPQVEEAMAKMNLMAASASPPLRLIKLEVPPGATVTAQVGDYQVVVTALLRA